MAEKNERYDGSEIAIVGMACRFPGAATIDEFWRNLAGGVESLTLLTGEDLARAGVPPELAKDPRYVRRASVVDGIEMFEPAFFGYTPLEAKIMDPQHRLFLECAWEVFEQAGYDPAAYPAPVGVFTGAKTNTYLFSLFTNREVFRTLDTFQIALGNDLASMATRVSYRLNLRGPSYALHTACSTSLVAVHLACQSLLLDECRMAVAGGAAINVPQRKGYLYQTGGILSPDGSCRTFDARAQGSNFGNGVGALLLKRLDDAIADGDHVYALVRGSATNNDGASKASYTAPGVEGQTAVLLEAMACAGVDADTISYVEAHGTATELGDSIEMLALTEAFRAGTSRRRFCAIGSVKTNIGHLETAAGVAGLIKTALALEHGQIPPSLNYESPNPRIDFDGSPFYVNTELSEWRSEDGEPRRAGVSSFGIGSTNAHVILEEAPAPTAGSPSRPWQLLVLSARSESAVETMTANLARHLEDHPEIGLADAAYTLQVGRRTFPHRRALIVRDRDGAITALREADPARVHAGEHGGTDRSVVFLFPGLGEHYVDMGLDLYRREPAFREALDRCAELLEPELRIDLREVLYPRGTGAEAEAEEVEAGDGKPDLRRLLGRGSGPRDKASRRLDQTRFAQPATFCIEYALACMWMEWGIKPQAMTGYSVSEYVAACLAGVLSLQDALRLVARRAALVQELPGGVMTAVPLPEAELAPLLPRHRLSLSVVNAPALCVAAGPEEGIAALERELQERGTVCRRLPATHAFHSWMLEPAAEALTELARSFELRPPAIPYVSNVTGTWITADQATDPAYWARHLVATVRFAEGIGTLLAGGERIFLEAGPGQSLGSFVRLHPDCDRERGRRVFASLRAEHGSQAGQPLALETLGRLWIAGAPVDWKGFSSRERRQRVPLPTYPFERGHHWVDPGIEATGVAPRSSGLEKKPDIRDWFYLPVWRRQELSGPGDARGNWLVLLDPAGLGERLATRLRQRGAAVTVVRPGAGYERAGSTFTVQPAEADDWQALLRELGRMGRSPRRIVHLGSVTPGEPEAGGEDLFRSAQETGFYSLVALAQGLGRHGITGPVRIDVVSNQVQELEAGDPLAPEKSTILGACLVIPQEHPNFTCRSIDVRLGDPEQTADQLLAEVLAGADDLTVAHRGAGRFVQAFEPFPLEPASGPVFREGGVYLITGGIGGIGLVLARHLAREARARLVLTRRTPLEDDPAAPTVRRVRELEELGAEVLVESADVADETAMRRVVGRALERFGAIHGVIHAAGVLDPATFKTVLQTTRAECEAQFHPKVYGLYVLERALAGVDLDFCLLYSSLSAVLGGLGYAGYATANLFMDFFARRHNQAGGAPWISVDWDSWHYQDAPEAAGGIGATLVELAVTPQEGIESVRRVLALDGIRHIVMSTGELQPRIDQWVQLRSMRAAEPGEGGAARPRLKGSALPSGGELERRIAGIWSRLLGVDEVGVDENFFDLGGNSLLGMQLVGELNRELGVEVTPVALFESPTVASLARQLSPRKEETAPTRRRRRSAESQDVAIIGMACRLPGSASVDEFWRNLREGRETISFFTDEELLEAGLDPAHLQDPSYVKARPILEGVELFDAQFFGYSARDAELMDPQHRLFLENAWEAVENAGYDSARYDGLVGVYAGASISSYMYNIYSNPELVEEVGTFPILIGNEKDAVTTKVSYKLDLKGPSLAVQTFCSTSLVAVHLACQALLTGECDMALAGGVSVILPQKSGYHYQEGGIGSADGHIHAFDAKASGIVFGNGLGVVVLKRLEDALADGDRIRAVIKASAVNNDGSVKAGYTATSVDGQADVVAAALEISGVHPETIGYMEAHGTGTPLGDPIEMAALSKAFRSWTSRRQFCPIGSAKTNVGHLDRAAGVTGLMKAVLALEKREIPPSLHFEEPNPNIDFDDCPFFVNTELRPWESVDGPRRAGVNSLGLGGTNAHVVLEEAPYVESSGASRPWQLLQLSAQTPTALDAATGRLAAHLREHPDLDGPGLADAAFTLQVGRKALPWRRIAICRDRADALEALDGSDPRRLQSGLHEGPSRPVVFLFPGLGGQYPGMARGLYDSEPAFRDEVDRCAELLRPLLGLDLREVIHPAGSAKDAGEDGVDLRKMLRRGAAGETGDAAARRLNETWLAQPAVFVIEYALARLWMSWGVRPAAVLGYSVGEYAAACVAGALSLEDALTLVARRARMIQDLPSGAMLALPLSEEAARPWLAPGLSLAAVNGPEQSIVAGPEEEVAALEARLAAEGIVCRRLQTTHAFHSTMMDPLFEPLAELCGTVLLQAPGIPYLSNVTGTWITPEEAVDPGYWARHMCGPVRFSGAVRELLQGPFRVLLELGPGQVLGSLILQHPREGEATPAVVASLRHFYERQADEAYLLQALGRLWLAGAEIGWGGFYARERRLRVELPTYPWERRRYWIEPGDSTYTRGRRMLAAPRDVGEWLRAPTWKRTFAPAISPESGGHWLVLADDLGLGDRLAERLRQAGREVVTVRAGELSARLEPNAFVLDPLEEGGFENLLREVGAVDSVVHLWALAAGSSLPAPDRIPGLQPNRLWVVASGMYDVHGDEPVLPEQAALVGMARCLPWCHTVDVQPTGDLDRMAGLLADELLAARPERSVALRGNRVWVPALEPIPSPGAGKTDGVWLLAGPLEGLGLRFANLLARAAGARLVLVDPVASPDETLARTRALERLGARVEAPLAGLADEVALREALAGTCDRLGLLRGAVVFLGPGSLEEHAREVGALSRALAGTEAAFLVSVRPEDAGQASLGAWADALGGRGWTSVGWDLEPSWGSDHEEVLSRLLTLRGLDQVVVSQRVLADSWDRLKPSAGVAETVEEAPKRGRHPRPELRVEFVAPSGATETAVAAIWQDLLGLAEVGVHDSFLDLGGDSLLASRLLTRLRDAFGLDLPIRTVFEASTVAELARVVEESSLAGAEVELSEDEMAEMSALLEGMTDEEVEAELSRRSRTTEI